MSIFKLSFYLSLLLLLTPSYSQQTEEYFQEAQFQFFSEEEILEEEVKVDCEVECPQEYLQEVVKGQTLNFKPCCFRSYSSCDTYSNAPICARDREPCQGDHCYRTLHNACTECTLDPAMYYAKEACPEDPDIEEECPVECPEGFTTRDVGGVEVTFKPCCFGDCVECSRYRGQAICVLDMGCQEGDCVETMDNSCLECRLDGNIWYSRGACPSWGEEDPLREEWLNEDDMWRIEQEIVIISEEDDEFSEIQEE